MRTIIHPSICEDFSVTRSLKLYAILLPSRPDSLSSVEVRQPSHNTNRAPAAWRTFASAYTVTGLPRQFQRFQPTVDAFKYSFLPRTISAWNALPQAVAEADSLDIFKRHMSRHLQFWPSASCTMHIVCTCSTAHSFLSGFNLYAPVFAVADHRGQDPASSVLSFEGRCYLLIQIQIQIPRFRIRCWHKLQKFQIDSYKNLFYAFWN